MQVIASYMEELIGKPEKYFALSVKVVWLKNADPFNIFLILPFQVHGNYTNRLQKSHNQQKSFVLFTHISLSTSSQRRVQQIMAASDGLQDPYLTILDLTTLEYLNFYNKKFFGFLENDRYDLTMSKCTDFYQ